MTATTKADADAKIAAGDRPLSLSECAEILKMKRPNVAKFLARRGVLPAFPKAQGYFWWKSDIERVKAEREADEGRMASDARRRETAVARAAGEEEPDPEPTEVVRLGGTQRAAMLAMLRRPVERTDANRFALRRLGFREYAEPVPDSGGSHWQLTAEGRRVAAEIES